MRCSPTLDLVAPLLPQDRVNRNRGSSPTLYVHETSQRPELKVSDLLDKIRELVEIGEVRISERGYDELSDDRVPVRDAVQGIREAVRVEGYPASGRGPAILVLEYDRDQQPIHVV